MSTDVIDRAGQATRAVKLQYRDLRNLVEGLAPLLECNANGVLIDHAMLLADLDGVVRAVAGIQTTIINTHWPSEAEYSEV